MFDDFLKILVLRVPSNVSLINSIIFSTIPLNVYVCGQISSANLQIVFSLLFEHKIILTSATCFSINGSLRYVHFWGLNRKKNPPDGIFTNVPHYSRPHLTLLNCATPQNLGCTTGVYPLHPRGFRVGPGGMCFCCNTPQHTPLFEYYIVGEPKFAKFQV